MIQNIFLLSVDQLSDRKAQSAVELMTGSIISGKYRTRAAAVIITSRNPMLNHLIYYIALLLGSILI